MTRDPEAHSGSGGGGSSSFFAVAAAGVAGVALGAAAVYLHMRRSPPPPSSSPATSPPHPAPAAGHAPGRPSERSSQSVPSVRRFREDEVLVEQFTRNMQFFGEEAQQQVADAFVVVVGLGGVGSHAAHLLLRSGVGKLRLIDFDQVTLSSLNRHAVATRADVGTPKATCLERHFREMLPEAEIESVVEMYTADKEEQLLGGNPDFVLDAIDNLETKAALIAACKRRGIRVLCSAGAGAKADPTRLRVVDMSEASVDPLSKAVRHRLRVEHGVWGQVPVLLSLEKPRCKLVSLVEMEAGNALDYQIVPNFRVRTIPVLGTTPALFGMAAASYILCHLAGAPWEGEPLSRPLTKEYERLLRELREREMGNFGDACPPCPLDLDDVIFITRELWRAFSARHLARTVAPGADKGFTRCIANLTLARWDKRKPPTVDNVVLLTHEEANAHDATSLEQLAAAEPAFVSWVEGVLDHARRQYFY